METFKAGAELGLDCFLRFNEKPIMPTIKAFEKKLDKMAKEFEFIISGNIRVFEKSSKLGKLFDKIRKEKIKVTVSRSCQSLWLFRFEQSIKDFHKKLESFANKNKLFIHLDLRCWRI